MCPWPLCDYPLRRQCESLFVDGEAKKLGAVCVALENAETFRGSNPLHSRNSLRKRLLQEPRESTMARDRKTLFTPT